MLHPAHGVRGLGPLFMGFALVSYNQRILRNWHHRTGLGDPEHRSSCELTRLAERPTAEELFERVAKRRGGKVGLAQAVADFDDERSAS